jgi:Ran GTPase-activating protein (RanGAP) involved in mRNA processing and transport
LVDPWSLDLAKNSFTENGIKVLCEKLKKSETIVSVNFVGNQLAPALFEMLEGHNFITSIAVGNGQSFQGIKLSSQNAVFFGKVLQNPECLLTTLEIVDLNLTQQAHYTLAKAISGCQSVEDLNLRGNAFGCDNQTFLRLMEVVPRLISLNLSQNGLDDKNIECLAKAIGESRTLKILNLSSNLFGSRGLIFLLHGLREQP